MRYPIYILFVFLLTACNDNGSIKENKALDSSKFNVSKKDELKEMITKKDSTTKSRLPFNNEALTSKIDTRLLKLSFIRRANTYIDSFSQHKHGIAFLYDSSEYGISVNAGYNGNEFRFETYYHFEIDPSTLAISVQDETGEMISINEYIRRQRNNNKK